MQVTAYSEAAVLRFVDIDALELASLLARFGVELCLTSGDQAIPGSFWGDEEAGLIGNRLHLRNDTPLHSILHESCHYICMDADRRNQLNTNAGGNDAEENAVCYLQILLARELSFVDDARMFSDMDAWGYSFRLGSTRAWFERDAEDALAWLVAQGLTNVQAEPQYCLR